jgi:osmotically-inducible protein OsmY
MEGSASTEPAPRTSLFDCKDDFIDRMAPIGMAAIYFGGISRAPQDAALSRQALFKLSFLHRHFLHTAGLRISVQGETALFTGVVKSKNIVSLADLLARQIEGIQEVRDETELPQAKPSALETVRESVQLMFATDQALRTGLQVSLGGEGIILEGEMPSSAQKAWAEQLAADLAGWIDSRLKVSCEPSATPVAAHPVDMDDESLQALAQFRLRLVRQAEYLPLRVKASRGIVTLQGRVRTEALRQRAENLTLSTLGLRELRSSLSIAA